jgi:hypothetical protein
VNRQICATLLKNKIKQVYGQHSFSNYDAPGAKAGEGEEDDCSHLVTPGAVAILQQNLPTLMVSSPKIFAEQFLEMISLMSKRWVQIEWPTLLPELISYLSSG